MYKAIKLITILTVFKPPTIIIKYFPFSFFVNDELRTAAWLGPMPGSKPVIMPAITERKIAARPLPTLTSGVVIDCGGRLVSDFRLRLREEIPNKPEKRGNKGSLTGRFKTAIPSTPDSKKVINANSFDFLSFRIRIMQEIIKM